MRKLRELVRPASCPTAGTSWVWCQACCPFRFWSMPVMLAPSVFTLLPWSGSCRAWAEINSCIFHSLLRPPRSRGLWETPEMSSSVSCGSFHHRLIGNIMANIFLSLETQTNILTTFQGFRQHEGTDSNGVWEITLERLRVNKPFPSLGWLENTGFCSWKKNYISIRIKFQRLFQHSLVPTWYRALGWPTSYSKTYFYNSLDI